MQQLLDFCAQYGWQLALIALGGVIVLGILKYANAFGKIDKDKRKPIYLAISVGLSLIGTAVYLLIIKQFNFTYFLAIAAAVYALNQTIYAVYETTTLKDLINKLIEKLMEWVKSRNETVTETTDNLTTATEHEPNTDSDKKE